MMRHTLNFLIKKEFYFLMLLSFFLSSNIFAQNKNTPANWYTFNRNYEGDRYSPLNQINKRNVSNLKLLHTFELGNDKSNFQCGPIVVDGIMYITTDTVTYAIDASNGNLKWKYSRIVKPNGGLNTNRGAAYYDGKIIRGGNDVHVFALDALTGLLLWDVPLEEAKFPGTSIPMAPIAWNGMVFIGHAGGDQAGITGHFYALNTNNGEIVWKFNVVPESGPIREGWTAEAKGLPATGGCFWTSVSLDEKAGILYIPTGNPAPDFDIEVREGKNLYANCIIALDAKTGKLLAYNQVVKNDAHDWDVAASPALLTTKNGRKIVASANKDGLLTILDRGDINLRTNNPDEAMPFIYAVPITVRENTDVQLSREKFTHFKPGILGGAQWNGPAYHPEFDLIYTGAIDWGTKVKLASLEEARNNVPELGAIWFGGNMEFDDPKTARGWIYAHSAKDGDVKWKYQTSSPAWPAVTPTAGGLLFCGSAKGEVYAFDAENGDLLWEFNTGVINGGGIVSYEVNGKQYIAVVAGLKRDNFSKDYPKDNKVLIFGL